MPITTMSSREFNQAVSEAKKAAIHGPVFITDRGRLAHVLMSMDQYQAITAGRSKIADLLFMPGTQDIALDPPRLEDLPRPADFS